MIYTGILEGLKKLSVQERLEIIDAVVHLLRQDLHQIGQPITRQERKKLLVAAAELLLPDYERDDELISFTALDGEDFHAQG
jgi:hypothetical protein